MFEDMIIKTILNRVYSDIKQYKGKEKYLLIVAVFLYSLVLTYILDALIQRQKKV